MKKLLLLLSLSSFGWASDYQKIDSNYKLFNFSIETISHTDESRVLLYEAPHGLAFADSLSTIISQHTERFWLDLRYIEAFGYLNIPILVGMHYHTFLHPGHARADDFQINAAFITVASPRCHGLSASYEAKSMSNSGHQAFDSYLSLAYQNQEVIPFLSLAFSYYFTNGSGIYTVIEPNQTQVGQNMAPQAASAYVWQARKGYLLDLVLDGKAIGLDAYLKGSYRKYWHDDPTDMRVFGLSYERWGLYYGNSFFIGRDLKFFGECGGEVLRNIMAAKVSVGLQLSTNFD